MLYTYSYAQNSIYSNDFRKAVNEDIEFLFSKKTILNSDDIFAIVIPSGKSYFSGSEAANIYSSIIGKEYTNIVFVTYGKKTTLLKSNSFETPVGIVNGNNEFVMSNSKKISVKADNKEISNSTLLKHIPFLQFATNMSTNITPLFVNPADVDILNELLKNSTNTLFVITEDIAKNLDYLKKFKQKSFQNTNNWGILYFE